MSRITSLSLRYIPRSTFTDVFLSTLKTWGKRLESLDIDWIHPDKSTPVPPLDVMLPELHSLRVGGRLDRTAGDLLLSSDSFRKMPALRLLNVRTFEEDSLLLLLRSRYLGKKLLHFDMTIPVFWSCDISDENFPFPVNLRYNKNLYSLRFSHPIHLGRDAWFVAKMSATASSKNLNVHITVSSGVSQEMLAACDASELDRCLIGTDVTKRRILHVHPDSHPPPWYKATIHALLPELSRHGYLLVHHRAIMTS
ncbi:hypothetical protein H0H87_006646 [Tephrocybe sp. NHM501043]|nr:hypothetical protein H0H87_006646 [Tephrocybe sp. NHM501043]